MSAMNHSAMADIIRDSEPNELPGVKKKSFAMFFGGGEIWFEHLDGMYSYSTLVAEKFNADKTAFRRPSGPSLMAVVLDETEITDEIAELISSELMSGAKRFTRVNFVGLDRKNKRRFKKLLAGADFALGFIDDFERAKEWLVSEEPE